MQMAQKQVGATSESEEPCAISVTNSAGIRSSDASWRTGFSYLERNHQGLGNELIEPSTMEVHGRVECRERLGGVLKYYYLRAP